MLVDRVLVGLGVVVITAGAALGWVGTATTGDLDLAADIPAVVLGQTGAIGASAGLLGVAAPAVNAAVVNTAVAPARPAMGMIGAWDSPWWTTPWESTWGQLSGTGFGRAPDAGSDDSGVGALGYATAPAPLTSADSAEAADSVETAEVATGSAAGRVLAAGIAPVPAPAARPSEQQDASRSRAKAAAAARQDDRAAVAAERAAARRAAETKATGRVAVPVALPGVEIVKRTYAYGPFGTRNEMDVYRTADVVADATRRQPTVVLVHGGSWVKGSKNMWSQIAGPFVEAGYTVVAINYRLAGDAAWPAQRTDVVAAVQALKDNAALYNVDPDKVVLVGSSAGGQLVASAATWEEAPGLVRGFVSLSGPLDMFKLVAAVGRSQEKLAGQVMEQLMRCEPQDCAAKYDDATPARHLDPSDASSLLIASEGDWVSPDGAREYSAASNNAGVASDFWVVSGKAHGLDMWDDVRQRVLDWVSARFKD